MGMVNCSTIILVYCNNEPSNKLWSRDIISGRGQSEIFLACFARTSFVYSAPLSINPGYAPVMHGQISKILAQCMLNIVYISDDHYQFQLFCFRSPLQFSCFCFPFPLARKVYHLDFLDC